MLSERTARELRRELEKDYWTLVNLRAERDSVVRAIEDKKLRLEAWRVLIAAYQPESEAT
jgi:hypothetical protein